MEKKTDKQQAKQDLQTINKFYAPQLEKIKQESECFGKLYDPDSTYCKKLCFCPEDCKTVFDIDSLKEEAAKPVNRFMLEKKKKGRGNGRPKKRN